MHTVDTVDICLRTTAIVLDNLRVNEQRTREAATKGYLNATELADYLVKKGMPFREAHEVVGKAVVFAMEMHKELHELDLSDMRRFSRKIDADVFEALKLNSALAAKNVDGGTSPKRVIKALSAAKRSLHKK